MKYMYLLIFLVFFSSCKRSLNEINTDMETNYQILYQKQDSNSHWQIFLNNISGNALKNISNNPSDDAYGALWSPDGNFIAFRYDRENAGGSDIYLYDVKNANKANITSDFTIEESASPVSWSPDSKKILYHFKNMGEPSYFCIMNSDGTAKKKLIESGSISFIDFGNQSRTLLYNKGSVLYKLNIMSLSQESILNFKDISIYSTWVDDYDPVSNIILCHEDSSSWNGGATFLIKKINLNTLRSDTLVIAESGTKLFRPIFSNDYSKIVYIERNYSNNISKLILLQDSKKIELSRLTDENEGYGIDKIEFSPKDSYLTYTIRETIPGNLVRFKSYVYILNISTKEAYLVDQAKGSCWNPLINF